MSDPSLIQVRTNILSKLTKTKHEGKYQGPRNEKQCSIYTKKKGDYWRYQIIVAKMALDLKED